MQGAFPLPLKWLRKQEWENAWLASSAFGLVFIPWILAAVVVPHLAEVLARTSWPALSAIFLFGSGWGVGGLLFGIAVHRLGLSLTTGIALGMTSAVGSGLPLLIYHPEQVGQRVGLLVIASLVSTIAGLAACTIAGRSREALDAPDSTPERDRYWLSVALCGLSGLLSPMFNFVIIYGDPLVRQAVQAGAHPLDAPNLVIAVGMTGGMVPTAGYCVYLLNRRRTWRRYAPPGHWADWMLTLLMGALFALGNAAYGMGAASLGSLGAILGFPVFMAMQVLTGNVLGYASGEWRGAGPRLLRLLMAGNLLLVLAIFLIGWASDATTN